MKKEQIDFHVPLKDAYGKVIAVSSDADSSTETSLETNETSETKVVKKVPVMIDDSLINILAHRLSLGEKDTLTGVQVLARLALQQKIAVRKPQVYTTDELSIIRKAVLTMFNNRALNLELAGTILKMTE